MRGLTLAALFTLTLGFSTDKSSANPYFAKAGEAPMPERVATCAISGGFIHLSQKTSTTAAFSVTSGAARFPGTSGDAGPRAKFSGPPIMVRLVKVLS